MVDISKCTGVDCPLREACYRYTAKGSQLQAYADFKYDQQTKDCEYYWPVAGGRKAVNE